MGEIVEEVEDNSNTNIKSNGNVNNGEEARTRRREFEDMKNMVEITLRTIGPSPPSRLLVPSPIKVRDLRKLIAENNHLPIESLRLICRGTVVNDGKDEDDSGDVYLRLSNNDSVMVAVKPKPPAKHLRDEFDFEDDDLKFRLPQSTSQWKKKLYSFLRDKLKVPDILLMALFTLSLKVWVFSVLWFILAPVAHRWDLGPLYAFLSSSSILDDGKLVISVHILYSMKNSGSFLGPSTQITWIETLGLVSFELCSHWFIALASESHAVAMCIHQLHIGLSQAVKLPSSISFFTPSCFSLL